MAEAGRITNAELGRRLDSIDKKIDKALNDHEQRIRRVEKIAWIGFGLAFAGGVSGVASLFPMT